MSVWSTAVQKLDVAKLIYEDLNELCDTILGPKCTPYLKPSGKHCPIKSDDCWEDVASVCGWKVNDALSGDLSEIKELVGGKHRWFVGLEAVYQVIHAVYNQRFGTRTAYDYSFVEETVQQFGLLVTPSTQLTPGRFAAEWGSRIDGYLETAEMIESASEAFKHLRLAFDGKRREVRQVNQGKFFGEGRRCYYGLTAGNLMVMKGAKELVDRALIFTRSHLDILVEALSRLGNTYFYLASQYTHEPQTAMNIHMMIGMQVSAAASAKRENANLVVKAFHKARAYTQMRMQENLHQGALAEAVKDFEADGLDQIFPLLRYVELAESLPISRRTDILQAYKWMPPPDFDSTYAFTDLRKWHHSPRPSGADPDASPEMKALWESVKSERKMNLAAAIRQMTGEFPTELNCKASGPTLLQCQDWKPFGVLPYFQYGTDIVSQVKDKATVEPVADDEYYKPVNSPSESFLLWYLEYAGLIDTKEDLKDYHRGVLGEDNYVRVAYKPEAHKPGSRLFHMAPPRTRIILGEMEGNLSRVAGAYPGSLQGKGTADRERIIASIMDLNTPPPGVDEAIEYTCFVVTFDLSKFSPKSNFNVTEDYHKFWADVYAKPELASLATVGCKGEILHTTAGLKMRYTNPGADLEGFRGRLQTMFHSDMLAASCRLSKERGFTTGKGVLGVFIDDGAVKIACKGEGEVAMENINGFLKAMQDVYAACGQENHPNKTVISAKGGEILADQYHLGVKLPTPIKAAQRLAPDYENAAAALTEELDALFAASQGCVKDGGDWIQTYKRYVTACTKSILRWARRVASCLDPSSLALKMMTPKSYGGFGLQPLQCLVTTAGVNLTVEGFGMLNRAARFYPNRRGLIKKIVTKEVLERDPLSILRDPTRVRAAGSVLVENRLMMKVVKWLEERPASHHAFMAAYRDVDLKEHATAVAVAILSSNAISVPLLQRAWKITPLSYVESVVSKFRRSATIIKLIGHGAMVDIRKKNAKDVEMVLLQ